MAMDATLTFLCSSHASCELSQLHGLASSTQIGRSGGQRAPGQAKVSSDAFCRDAEIYTGSIGRHSFSKLVQAQTSGGCRRIVNRKGTTRQDIAQTSVAVEASTSSKSLGVVITGGTKGLGFAFARKFLEAGDRVVICGRDEARLNSSITKLRDEIEGVTIDGIACNVAKESEVQRLAEFAVERLGVIDRWLNNAGEVTTKKLLADVRSDEIVRVCGTNVVGSLLCCKEAIRCMRQQHASVEPKYHIFNMGFTRWGAKFTKSACTHKATKIALTQLTESLVEELKTAGISSIGVHNLSPGLVLTDLLLMDSDPIARRFFNTLAEEPDTAAEILVPSIRQVQGTGHNIAVLSPVSAFCKVVTRFPQIISGGRFFDKDGNRVAAAGKKYHDNGVEVIY